MSASAVGHRLLLLDPPPARLARLAEALGRKGHLVSRCDSAEAALALLGGAGRAPPADLLLLHPPGNARAALELLRRLRAASSMPVVVLGGPSDGSAERVAALEMGADDHLDPRLPLPEMLARLQALLRRVGWCTASDRAAAQAMPGRAAGSLPIQGGWHLLHHRRLLACAAGRETLPLTSAEFEMLRLLDAAQGEAVDRDAISRIVFRRPWRVEDRAVDGLVKRLRRKLRSDAIASVRGVGYALRFEVPGGPAGLDEAASPARMHAAVEFCGEDASIVHRSEQPEVVNAP